MLHAALAAIIATLASPQPRVEFEFPPYLTNADTAAIWPDSHISSQVDIYVGDEGLWHIGAWLENGDGELRATEFRVVGDVPDVLYLGGEPVPGLENWTWYRARFRRHNADGTWTVFATLHTPSGSAREAVLRGSPSTGFDLIAVEQSDLVIGGLTYYLEPPGFEEWLARSYVFDADPGIVGFAAELSRGSTTYQAVLVFDRWGSLRSAMVEGSYLPGIDQDCQDTAAFMTTPGNFGGLREFVVTGDLARCGGPDSTDIHFLVEPDGTFRYVAASGFGQPWVGNDVPVYASDTAPGLVRRVVLGLDDAGRMLLKLRMDSPALDDDHDTWGFFGDPTHPLPIVREGDPAPWVGDDAFVDDFDAALFPGTGDVLLMAKLDGAGVPPGTQYSLARLSGGDFVEIARIGDDLEGFPAGQTIWSVWPVFAGDELIGLRLWGCASTEPDCFRDWQGLYFVDESYGLHFVTSTDEVLHLDGDRTWPVRGLSVPSPLPGPNGRGMAFTVYDDSDSVPGIAKRRDVWATLVPPCNDADFAEPLGLLDLADIVAFVQAFANGDPAADLAEPFGLLDLADITAFIGAFGAGCP